MSSNSVISSILFGAIAASGVLPFPRALYEQAITQSGVAVQEQSGGFAAGFERALTRSPMTSLVPPGAGPTTEIGRKLDARIKARFSGASARAAAGRRQALRGLPGWRLCDGVSGPIARDPRCDQRDARCRRRYALTAAVARHLALWMSYEDTIRVADLKTRRTRFERVRDEVQRAGGTDRVHDRVHAPALRRSLRDAAGGLGARLHASSRARRWFAPLFRKGRHIQTAHIGGFLLLYAVAGLRRWRRGTLRYRVEQERIGAWLARDRIAGGSPGGYDAAVELAECQRLVKGYSDTHERGLRNYGCVVEAVQRLSDRADLAAIVKRLRTAALADEEGRQLRAALDELKMAG